MSSHDTFSRNRDSHERRGARRVAVDFPVRLALARGRSAAGRMRNASLSGALIECGVELPVFTQLKVEILVSVAGLAEPMLIPARVVRAEHPRLGVEWRDFAPPGYASLLQENGLPAVEP